MPFQFVSLVLAFTLGALPAARGPMALGQPTLARLEIQISTSAPQTLVRLVPGTVLATRTSTTTGGVTATKLSNGWIIKRTASGTVSAAIRTVVKVPTGTGAVRVTLRTDGAGTASARLTNTSRAPFEIGRLVASSTSSAIRSVVFRRTAILGRGNPAIPRLDTRRLVLASYHPWYGSGYSNPMLSDRPADRRSTKDMPGVLSMTRQAKAAGIDGFLCSWAGAAQNGAEFDLVLRAAEEAGSVAGPYLATLGANPDRDPAKPASPTVVETWLSQALDRASSPAFLRSNGVPVVFVYQMKSLTPTQWSDVLARLRARGKAVRLVGDAGMALYGTTQWGAHIYSPHLFTPAALTAWNIGQSAEAHLLSTPPKLYVATVGPGYDDVNARGERGFVLPRGATGERYAATWQSALASPADWVLVTSWNEWFEGTHVEPGVESGDLALRQTATYSARFKDPARRQPLG